MQSAPQSRLNRPVAKSLRRSRLSFRPRGTIEGALFRRGGSCVADSLHGAWIYGGRIGVRCNGCDHRAILTDTEVPTIRRGNMTLLRTLKLRCQRCAAGGTALDRFTLYLPANQEQADAFMRGSDRMYVVKA